MKRISYKLIISAIFSCLLFNNRCSAQCTAEIFPNLVPFIPGCAPLTVSFSSDSSTGAITAYLWDFGDGSPTESTPNPTHTFTGGMIDTFYTVTFSITCSTAPFTHDTSVTVAVFTLPDVLFFVDTAAVCDFSSSVCFDDSSETGVGYTYNWDFGDGDTSAGSVFEPCHTYSTDSVYSVKLTVTSGNLCVDDTTIVINTAFSLLPIVSLSSSANNDTICDGDSITFLASPSGYLRQPVNYEFFIGATLVQSGLGNFFETDTLKDGDTMTVILVNANGCKSDTSNVIVTTVLLLQNVVLTSSDSILCQGDSIAFTASPANLNSYFFYNDTTLLQSSPDSIYISDNLDTGNMVFVVGVDAYGCVSPPSDTIITPVKPTPAPSISSNIIGMGICIGDSAILTVIDTALSGVNYIWSPDTATTDSITIRDSVNTTYYVSATLDGCMGTDSIVVLVDVVPPTADAGNDTTICEGNSLALTASGGITYLWNTGETTFSITVSPSATMTYTVTVIDTACSDNDVIVITVDECLLGEIPQVITPNGDGANDVFKILNIEYYPENNITIFNRWGNVVFNKKEYDNSWEGTSNTGNKLPDGTYYYILDLSDGNEPLVGYVLIHR